jgi:hypothetical protein
MHPTVAAKFLCVVAASCLLATSSAQTVNLAPGYDYQWATDGNVSSGPARPACRPVATTTFAWAVFVVPFTISGCASPSATPRHTPL